MTPVSTLRQSTATSVFGTGKREGHDASAFYARFLAPVLSTDEHIERPAEVDVIYSADARHMASVLDNSVALVVTSPPYFAGKQYEQSLGVNGVPADYFEYLEMLRDVFAECQRVLEPGGRIAVNVANLGRRPYRSLAADVTQILSDLGLLLRGEVVWWKGRAAGGSCAWGSFQSPANPVLRDVTERVIIAGKGRFDRALTPRQRQQRGFPSVATITREEFMEATTDIWEIAPESAKRIGHPAPFPVELPLRLIELFTYEGDVVLDPFMGAGSTAVAAVRTGRHYLGFDTDSAYVDTANERVRVERAQASSGVQATTDLGARVEADSGKQPLPGETRYHHAVRLGRGTGHVAEALLLDAGFTNVEADVKPRALGVEVSFVATDQRGDRWAFDVSGSSTTTRTGLRRSDTLWKALAKAGILHQGGFAPPLVLLSTDLPTKGSAGAKALNAMVGYDAPVVAVMQIGFTADHERLAELARHGRPALGPEPIFS